MHENTWECGELNPLTTGKPFLGTKLLGFSKGRGSEALKGLSFLVPRAPGDEKQMIIIEMKKLKLLGFVFVFGPGATMTVFARLLPSETACRWLTMRQSSYSYKGWFQTQYGCYLRRQVGWRHLLSYAAAKLLSVCCWPCLVFHFFLVVPFCLYPLFFPIASSVLYIVWVRIRVCRASSFVLKSTTIYILRIL